MNAPGTRRRSRWGVLLLLLPALLFPALLAGESSRENRRWYAFDTTGARVIYQGQHQAAARELAALLPTVLDRVTDYMNYQPEERIPVVLYGETATANGFFSPLPPHVALFLAAPSGPWMGARSESWLETVLVHELVHYLHLTRPIGFFGTASRVFGPLAAAGSVLFLPGWALEGITVSAETALTTGGRGRNPYFEMTWVAPVLEDALYSYDQAGVSSVYAPRGRIYSAGYIMVEHLRATFGDDAFVRLNREFQRWPFLGMRRALRRSTGTTATDFFSGLEERLAQDYATRRRLPAGAAVSPREPGDWYLLGATDRGLFAYRETPFHPGEIRRWDHTAEQWRSVAAVRALDEYSVAVDHRGKRAVAAVVEANLDGLHGGAFVSWSDLYVLNLPVDDGTSQAPKTRRITRGRRLYHPTFLSASQVLAVQRRGSYGELVQVELDTGDLTTIYAPSERTLMMPAVDARGSRIAVVENHRGRQSITVLRRHADGTGFTVEQRLNVGGPRDAEYRPYFSDDALWFVADAAGRLVLYRSAITEEGLLPPEPVLEDPVGVIAGIPAEDGTILYGSYRSEGFVIRRGHPANHGLEAAAVQTVDPPAATAAAAAAGPTVDLDESRRYWDLPRPVLWFPVASVESNSRNQTRADVGVTAVAASNLGRHRVDATAAYNPWDAIATGEIAWTYRPGATAFTLSAVRDYEYTTTELPGLPEALVEHTVEVAAERPMWYRAGPARSSGVVARLGTRYEAVEDPSIQAMALDAGVRIFRRRHGAAAQILGPAGVDLLSLGRWEPAVLDRGEDAFTTATKVSLRLGPRHGALGGRAYFEPSLAAATNTEAEAMENLPWRGPFFEPQGSGAIESAEVAGLGRLSLDLALWPLDAAWRGAAVQQLALALYGEQALSGSGKIDNYTVAGAEIVSALQFNIVPLTLTAGVALRIPHGGEAYEYQFYLRLGGTAVEQVETDLRP
mgnify:CR=1 FL=1